MSAKHTPGPWLITRGHQTGLIRGIHAPGRNIVNFGGISAPTQPESQANASLMVAAPDLYAACKACADGVKGWQELIHAAIVKAEGRTA